MHFTGKHIKHHTLGGRAYPVRHYPIAVRLRDRKGHAILCIALNPQSGDFSGAILGVRSVALLHGEIGEGIREVKETEILIKVLFLSFGVLISRVLERLFLRSFLGSYLTQWARTIIPSLVSRWSLTWHLNTRYKGIET